LSFCLTMLLAVFLALAMYALAFGGLPTSDEPQALGILAIALIPATRLKARAASLAKAGAKMQPPTAGRGRA
jgi:hypothetical protein